MDKKYISATVRQLLHDPDFVLWCMMPTDVLDEQWSRWINEHPECESDINEARIILQSVRLNDTPIPADKSGQLWSRLQRSIIERKKRRRLQIIRYAAACAVALVLGIGGFELFDKDPLSDSRLIAGTTGCKEDVHTDVTLITGVLDTVKIENNSLIVCDLEITVRNKEKVVTQKVSDSNRDETVMNTLVVPRGRRTSLLLADGSKVWVNSGSKLRFPSKFDAEKRMIEAEGEIYIEVARNGTPFYVKTDSFTVNVLGTKFNLSAYAGEQTGTVVLVEGSVMVRTLENENIHLSPNRMLTIEAGKGQIKEVDVNDYISWKDGYLQFREESMENILLRLSRYYAIQIKCKPEIAGKNCSGKLVLFEDIRQTMNTISMLYNIRYQFESDTLIIE